MLKQGEKGIALGSGFGADQPRAQRDTAVLTVLGPGAAQRHQPKTMLDVRWIERSNP